MKTLTVRTRNRTDFADITREIALVVTERGISAGTVTVFVPHTTCGITIQENADPDVMTDLGNALERAVPWQAGYAHGEGNAAAHVKSSLMGSSVQVFVSAGKLQLGIWQGIYLCEFDGPRTRQVWVE